MSDFQKGKIYKITNDYNEEIYIGSTCDTLVKRFSAHKKACNNDKSKHRPLYNLINEIGFDRFRIELIENYPCEDRYQLRQKEGQYIRQLGTLNNTIAGRTNIEYRLENKEKLKEYNMSEKAKQMRKVYREKDENKEKKRITDKNYKENNKEKINLVKKEMIVCECGGTFQHDGLARHKRTAKHTKYENDNI
jgi:group I intron endonuclease